MMASMTRLAIVGIAALLAAPVWTAQPRRTSERSRGIRATSERVEWASGSGGTIARTSDGGATWQRLLVPDAEKLDLRDTDAVSPDTAYALSIGNGEAS